jgi:hypothetical protein
MGIAKIIRATGEYQFHSLDYECFINIIGNVFKKNINCVYVDNFVLEHNYKSVSSEKQYHLGFENSLKIVANHYRYENTGIIETYYEYTLYISIDLEGDNDLWLTFYPNGIFQLEFIPFNGSWQLFIEDILGYHDCYYDSHEELVSEILKIRACYIDILKKINCTTAIIWTDGGYNTEHKLLTKQIHGSVSVLSDVIKSMNELDGIKIIPFMNSIAQKNRIESNRAQYLDIAFIDTF